MLKARARSHRIIGVGLMVLAMAGATSAQQSRVFAGSNNPNGDGDLGGLSGADAICQGLADAESLGGTWVAWLSTSSVDAKDRLTATGPFVRARETGTTIADNLADLIDGNLDNAIFLNETGSDELSAMFTGTTEFGLLGISDTCSDWTSSSGDGTVGDPSVPDSDWTNGDEDSCDKAWAFYCFEQAAVVPATPPIGLALLASLLLAGGAYLYRRKAQSAS